MPSAVFAHGPMARNPPGFQDLHAFVEAAPVPSSGAWLDGIPTHIRAVILDTMAALSGAFDPGPLPMMFCSGAWPFCVSKRLGIWWNPLAYERGAGIVGSRQDPGFRLSRHLRRGFEEVRTLDWAVIAVSGRGAGKGCRQVLEGISVRFTKIRQLCRSQRKRSW